MPRQSLPDTPAQVAQVRERIAASAKACGRSPESITLLAVSKGQPVEAIRAAAATGIKDFGESYLQEALPKIEALAELQLTWHFIGALQSNKTRPVAQSFAWVHGVDRLKVAARLSEQRPYHAAPLNVCLEVNLGAESDKRGVSPAGLAALAAAVAPLPRLTLRGLMCLPPQETEPDRARHWFAELARLRAELSAQIPQLDTLSMGMSGDFEAAILEGATIVRIGTLLFGPRPRPAP